MRQPKVRACASNFEAVGPPDHAFDGNRQTVWAAGDYAPQRLEADLGAAVQLGSIQLGTTQLPAGETTHEIWVSDLPIGEDRTGRSWHIPSRARPTAIRP
jgi:hypothetical protein